MEELDHQAAVLLERCESPIERLFLAGLLEHLRAQKYRLESGEFRHNTDDHVIRIDPQAHIESYRVDFLIEAYRSGGSNKVKRLISVVVECDGHEFHERTKEQAGRDKRRDRELQSRGHQVLRFTGSELVENARALVAEFFLDHVQRPIDEIDSSTLDGVLRKLLRDGPIRREKERVEAAARLTREQVLYHLRDAELSQLSDDEIALSCEPVVEAEFVRHLRASIDAILAAERADEAARLSKLMSIPEIGRMLKETPLTEELHEKLLRVVYVDGYHGMETVMVEGFQLKIADAYDLIEFCDDRFSKSSFPQ